MTVPATPVLLAIDASGSMHHLADDVIGGVNQYLDDLAADSAATYKVTVCLFNTRVVERLVDAPGDIARLTTDTYQPHGGTALYDAVGQLITGYEQEEGERPLVVVNTDGHENSSTTWTLAALSAMIAEKTKQGWGFVYLGSGIDTWEGDRMGMWSAYTVNTREGTQGMYSGLSHGTQMYSQGASGQSVTTTASEWSRDADKGSVPAKRATTPEEDNQHGE